jgi:hypothetical protein
VCGCVANESINGGQYSHLHLIRQRIGETLTLAGAGLDD